MLMFFYDDVLYKYIRRKKNRRKSLSAKLPIGELLFRRNCLSAKLSICDLFFGEKVRRRIGPVPKKLPNDLLLKEEFRSLFK